MIVGKRSGGVKGGMKKRGASVVGTGALLRGHFKGTTGSIRTT